MAQTRKTLPKTQYEISKETTTTTYNRANEVSEAGDTFKELSIGLSDLDYSIQYYFQNIIKPKVDDVGTMRDVPVLYGAPEKWKNIQADGYLRDKQGKILTPLIAFRRTGIAKNKTLGSKVDANNPAIYYTQQRKYTPENRYDQFSVLSNSKPIQTFVNTVMPDYVDLTYEVIVWTDYVEQMNKIVESILYTEGSYWGERERFKFRTKVDSFTNTTDLLQDTERVVRTSFTLNLYGQIVPDALVKQLSNKLSNKTFSPRQLVIETDVEDTPITVSGVSKAGVYMPSATTTRGSQGSSISTLTVAYLNTNKSVERTSISVPDTAIFTANFLAAPTELPTTGVGNFTFFVNGLYIEPSAIVSFTNTSSNVCTLVVDTTELGFTLRADDELVAIGKFA
jgi:hypothetical protein